MYLMHILIVISVLIGLPVLKDFIASEAIAKKPNNVATVHVLEGSYYVIDGRFNLCFYHTETNAIRIPCEPFNEKW